MVILLSGENSMRQVQATQAKASFSGLIAAVEAGEKIAIMRRGRVVACLVPHVQKMASEVLASIWHERTQADQSLKAPPDLIPEPTSHL
jgi:prevent-host-death family protein